MTFIDTLFAFTRLVFLQLDYLDKDIPGMMFSGIMLIVTILLARFNS